MFCAWLVVRLTHHCSCIYDSRRVDAGKVELDGATYFGFDLPFSLTQLIWIEVILVGGAEFYRNGELNPEKRLYPGEQSFGIRAMYTSAAETSKNSCCKGHAWPVLVAAA